jgi:hypothetical protein
MSMKKTCTAFALGYVTMLALVLVLPIPSTAEITNIVISSTQPYGEFTKGKYIRLEGEAQGVLSPKEPIPDLDKAPRNTTGLVEYRTPITLIIPESRRSGNGALLVEIPNRGRPISLSLYNSPRSRPILSGSLDQGTGFLQERGYSVAVVQWELGEGIQLPAFTDERGSKRYVEGIGFAAVRDVALFLRQEKSPRNPLSSAIERVYASGSSQTGRFLKSFLVNGFNEYNGRTAFDALHIIKAAAGGLPLLASGTGPGSVASVSPGHENPEYRGVHEEPFTYAEVMKHVAAKNRRLPLVIVNHMYNDYLGGRASLTRTGASGTNDLPIPENVRMYDIAGAAHINEREQNKACREGHSQFDWSPALRAQLVALNEWVQGKATPPSSRLLVLEPRPNDPDVMQAPAYLASATVLVPKLDGDGNPLGGIRLPDMVVPIASHGYMNAPLRVLICRQAGTYRPFARTVAERKTANDGRLSLEERYPDGLNEYVSKIRQAVRSLIRERLLLEEDGIVIIHAAAENPSFRPSTPRSRGSTGTVTR